MRMIQNANTWSQRIPGAVLVAIALFVIGAGLALAGPESQADADAKAVVPAGMSEAPPSNDELVQPEELARLLADKKADQPVLVHVGFGVLFQAGHIPGSRHIGPASTPERLADLKKFLLETPRQKQVVLYCGCCPWTDCPNVRPALQAVRELGLKNVRLLYLPNSLQHDWLDKGLPISKGDE
jgi:3-mercaptopyruvate sulfurtransferase SseA